MTVKHDHFGNEIRHTGAIGDKLFTGYVDGAASPVFGVDNKGIIPQVAIAVTRDVTFVGGAAITSLTLGTDTTPVNGTVFFGELFLPVGRTLTGVGYLIGSVGGTDKAIATLYDRAGAVLVTSALAGVTVGTTATIQELPFTATYDAVGPALYYVSISMNGTTARLRTHVAGGIRDGSATGTFGTLASITPPTTSTGTKAPVAYVY